MVAVNKTIAFWDQVLAPRSAVSRNSSAY